MVNQIKKGMVARQGLPNVSFAIRKPFTVETQIDQQVDMLGWRIAQGNLVQSV